MHQMVVLTLEINLGAWLLILIDVALMLIILGVMSVFGGPSGKDEKSINDAYFRAFPWDDITRTKEVEAVRVINF